MKRKKKKKNEKPWISNLAFTACYRHNLHQVRLLRSKSKEWISNIVYMTCYRHRTFIRYGYHAPSQTSGYPIQCRLPVTGITFIRYGYYAQSQKSGYPIQCARPVTGITFIRYGYYARSQESGYPIQCTQPVTGIAFIRYGYYAPRKKTWISNLVYTTCYRYNLHQVRYYAPSQKNGYPIQCARPVTGIDPSSGTATTLQIKRVVIQYSVDYLLQA